MATAASRGHAANHVPQECGYDRVPAGLSWLTRFAAFGVISVSKVRRHWALSGTIAHKMTMLQVFSRSHNLRICHFGTLTNLWQFQWGKQLFQPRDGMGSPLFKGHFSWKSMGSATEKSIP